MSPLPIYQLPLDEVQSLQKLARNQREAKTFRLLIELMEQGVPLDNAATIHALLDPDEMLTDLLELSGRSLSEVLTRDSEPSAAEAQSDLDVLVERWHCLPGSARAILIQIATTWPDKYSKDATEVSILSSGVEDAGHSPNQTTQSVERAAVEGLDAEENEDSKITPSVVRDSQEDAKQFEAVLDDTPSQAAGLQSAESWVPMLPEPVARALSTKQLRQANELQRHKGRVLFVASVMFGSSKFKNVRPTLDACDPDHILAIRTICSELDQLVPEESRSVNQYQTIKSWRKLGRDVLAFLDLNYSRGKTDNDGDVESTATKDAEESVLSSEDHSPGKSIAGAPTSDVASLDLSGIPRAVLPLLTFDQQKRIGAQSGKPHRLVKLARVFFGRSSVARAHARIESKDPRFLRASRAICQELIRVNPKKGRVPKGFREWQKFAIKFEETCRSLETIGNKEIHDSPLFDVPISLAHILDGWKIDRIRAAKDLDEKIRVILATIQFDENARSVPEAFSKAPEKYVAAVSEVRDLLASCPHSKERNEVSLSLSRFLSRLGQTGDLRRRKRMAALREALSNVSPGDWKEVGPLAASGYSVNAATRLTALERREAIEDLAAVDLGSLENISIEAERRAGVPMSSARWDWIGSYIRRSLVLHKDRENFKNAIAKWEDDLAWIHSHV